MWLALSLATLVAAGSSQPSILDAPTISYVDLISDHSASNLKQILSTTGLVAVTGVPGFETQRKDALGALLQCQSASFEQISTLADGTTRKAMASETAGGVPAPLSAQASDNCPAFAQAAAPFRNTITEVSSAFMAALSRSLGVLKAPRAQRADTFSSFTDIHLQGKQLEHFVAYTSPRHSPALSPPSLALHTDDGLFIAFTPPLLSKPTADTGLRIKQKNGQISSLRYEDPASIVFMLGAGFSRWLGPTITQSAVVHALDLGHLPRSSHRAWYGRMFLPPADSLNPSLGISFGTYRTLQLSAASSSAHSVFAPLANDLASLGCMPKTRASSPAPGAMAMLDSQLQSDCPADEYHCWMKCYTQDELPICSPNQRLECLRNSNGQTCNPATDMGCAPVCANLTAPDTSGDFCSASSAVSMYMQGFVSPNGNPRQACVVFLFPAWVLDTRTKFALACIFTFFFAIGAEVIIYSRRALQRWSQRHKHGRFRVRTFLHVALFGAQITCGYLLMLLAMTYSVPIFFCVIAGLIAGHVAFNMDRPGKPITITDGGATPCCTDPADEKMSQPLLLQRGKSLSTEAASACCSPEV